VIRALALCLVAGSATFDFSPPDGGPDKVPYACTFHWFRTADDRTVGMDVIRSEDTGQLGLRVFLFEADGTLRSLVHSAPAEEWAPFATDAPPALEDGVNTLGRGTNWIAGRVAVDGQSISSVQFTLAVVPESPGAGTGALGLAFAKLAATDFLRVRTTGTIAIDGVVHEIDYVGPASIHYGDELPPYAYIARIPSRELVDPDRLLLSSVNGENTPVLGDLALTYALGSGEVSAFTFRLGDYGTDRVEVGAGRSVELRDLNRFDHALLGRPTTTASAGATYVKPDPGFWPWQWFRKKRVDLGQVILDYRGEYYVDRLPAPPPPWEPLPLPLPLPEPELWVWE